MPLVNLLAGLLAFAFGDSVAALDSPRFVDRRAAGARLDRNGPLAALLLIRVIETTPSAETRYRCERTIERTLAIARRRVDRDVQLAGDAEWDAAIEQLVEDPHEKYGLPWERSWAWGFFEGHAAANEALRRAVRRGREEKWIGEDVYFSCESPYSCSGLGLLYGLTDLRLLRRGLPSTWRLAEMLGGSPGAWWPARLAWSVKKPSFR